MAGDSDNLYGKQDKTAYRTYGISRNYWLTMIKEDPRKTYWNEKYMEYWRARVAEAGNGESAVVQGDARTEDDEVYERIFSEIPFRQGNILDVGCAWGRMFPLYLAQGLKVSGVDISRAMIESAQLDWKDHKGVNVLEESSAEELPFEDEWFDNLVCLATFDATYQHKAMSEFLRVTRPGAHIYITGKNDNYFADDEAAIAAEIGARNKGHPNYFTDTGQLMEQLDAQGHKLLAAYYFLRRGDFADLNYTSDMPDQFYEYFLVFERADSYQTVSECSDLYSKTFKNIERAK